MPLRWQLIHFFLQLTVLSPPSAPVLIATSLCAVEPSPACTKGKKHKWKKGEIIGRTCKHEEIRFGTVKCTLDLEAQSELELHEEIRFGTVKCTLDLEAQSELESEYFIAITCQDYDYWYSKHSTTPES